MTTHLIPSALLLPPSEEERLRSRISAIWERIETLPPAGERSLRDREIARSLLLDLVAYRSRLRRISYSQSLGGRLLRAS